MSSLSQLETITAQLRDYFDKLNLNLSSTANPLPSFEDYVTSLVFDVIQTDATQSIDRTASYSTGALADTVHLTAAIVREFGMRGKLKADYFNDAEVDSATLVDYLDALYGQYLNYYRGTAPEQAGN